MPATSLSLGAAVRRALFEGRRRHVHEYTRRRMSMRQRYDPVSDRRHAAPDDAAPRRLRARARAAAARAALRGADLLRRARLARELRPPLAARLRLEPRRRLADRDGELPLDRRRADRRRPPARAHGRVEGAVGRARARRRSATASARSSTALPLEVLLVGVVAGFGGGLAANSTLSVMVTQLYRERHGALFGLIGAATAAGSVVMLPTSRIALDVSLETALAACSPGTILLALVGVARLPARRRARRSARSRRRSASPR